MIMTALAELKKNVELLKKEQHPEQTRKLWRTQPAQPCWGIAPTSRDQHPRSKEAQVKGSSASTGEFSRFQSSEVSSDEEEIQEVVPQGTAVFCSRLVSITGPKKIPMRDLSSWSPYGESFIC